MSVLKSKAGELYRQLPRVPSTRFLSAEELRSEILFNGYRPMISPVKENPLVQAHVKQISFDEDMSDRTEENHVVGTEQEEIPFMAGPKGTGGIVSGGVNGTWRYNPRIPNKLLQNALWSCSAMGMEYYPEWTEVPSEICGRLKPFQLEKRMRPGLKNGKKNSDSNSYTTSINKEEEEEDFDLEKSMDKYEEMVQRYLKQWKRK